MSAKYQAYPEYKDSGVEWLGDVPAHWTQVPLKRVCSLKTGLTPPTDNQANYVDEENDKPWVRPEDLKENGNVITASKFLSQSGWELMRIVPPYSTLICCIGTIGKTGYVGSEVSSNQQITSASFNSSPRFNYYLIQSAKEVLEETATGNVIQILNSERLGGIGFLSAPEMEANRIANFLDHETAKIDTLIEKQQQLIKLLKEKRQAVISHAVTKGLNPNAPMRDSGVEWLGEVPEHWERFTFKYLLEKMVDNRGRTPPTFDQGIPLLEAKHIDGTLKFASDNFDKFIDEVGHKGFIRDDVQEGDILFITVGTIGKTCLVPCSPEFVIAQNIVALRTLENCNPLFLLFWLRSLVARECMLSTNKDSILDSIKISDFVQSRLYIPPTMEQEDIATFLDQEIVKIDGLIKKADAAIGLMQERRTALISAAVTGKIDVRNQNNR